MSNRRLTTLDASFLEVESPSAHMHVGWAALFSPPRGRRRAELRGAARPRRRAVSGRAPRYRQRLAAVPLGADDPVWVDDEDFDVDRHVRRADSSDFDELTDAVHVGSASTRPPALGALDRRPARRRADRRDRQGPPLHGRRPRGGRARHAAARPDAETPDAEPDGWRRRPRPPRAKLLAEARSTAPARLVELARWPLGFARHRRATCRRLVADAARSARAMSDSLRPASRRARSTNRSRPGATWPGRAARWTS